MRELDYKKNCLRSDKMETEKCINCSGPVEKGYKYCLTCYKQYQEEKKHEEEEKKEGAVYKKIKKDKQLDASFKGIEGLIEANNKNTKLIINQLEKNNNNLYNLVKCFSVVLEKQFSCAVVWDKKKANKKGDFVVKKLK